MEVFAIKDERKLALIKRNLSNSPRNLLLFTMGINTGLRVGDLLNLKVSQVKGLLVGDKVSIVEGKTGKQNYFVINSEIDRVLHLYWQSLNKVSDRDWLFPSRKGSGPLTVVAVNHLMKIWCDDVGVKVNVGAHTLRKTFGYMMYQKHKVPLEVLMKRFSHSSQGITLRYIGIDEQQVSDCLMISI